MTATWYGQLQGRIQRGATGPWPPNHGWKIKTQLPRIHVGTAATINDHKTAHKHSSLAPFQTWQHQKAFSFRGASPPDQRLCPWTPLGAQPPDPHYRLAHRARHMAPSNLYSWNRPWPADVHFSGFWWIGDTDDHSKWQTNCDFLFTLCSNHGSISYCFKDNDDKLVTRRFRRFF